MGALATVGTKGATRLAPRGISRAGLAAGSAAG